MLRICISFLLLVSSNNDVEPLRQARLAIPQKRCEVRIQTKVFKLNKDACRTSGRRRRRGRSPGSSTAFSSSKVPRWRCCVDSSHLGRNVIKTSCICAWILSRRGGRAAEQSDEYQSSAEYASGNTGVCQMNRAKKNERQKVKTNVPTTRHGTTFQLSPPTKVS